MENLDIDQLFMVHTLLADAAHAYHIAWMELCKWHGYALADRMMGSNKAAQSVETVYNLLVERGAISG